MQSKQVAFVSTIGQILQISDSTLPHLFDSFFPECQYFTKVHPLNAPWFNFRIHLKWHGCVFFFFKTPKMVIDVFGSIWTSFKWFCVLLCHLFYTATIFQCVQFIIKIPLNFFFIILHNESCAWKWQQSAYLLIYGSECSNVKKKKKNITFSCFTFVINLSVFPCGLWRSKDFRTHYMKCESYRIHIFWHWLVLTLHSNSKYCICKQPVWNREWESKKFRCTKRNEHLHYFMIVVLQYFHTHTHTLKWCKLCSRCYSHFWHCSCEWF